MNNIIEKFNFINLEEIDSTNSYIKRNADTLPDLTVVTAEFQTAGRGRLGRSFFSPKGTGAYFSLFLKNNISKEISRHLTVIAAVAVLEEIKSVTSGDVKIKWVNDVYIDGKKTCGILTEGSVNPRNGELSYAIIGVGINLTMPKNAFPKDLADKVNFVFDSNCTETQKKNLIYGIVSRIYKMITDKNMEYIDIYIKNSYLDGKKINIIRENSTESATAVYIDENCNLLVKKDGNGELETLFSGDVSIT